MPRYRATAEDLECAIQFVLEEIAKLPLEAHSRAHILPKGGFPAFVREALRGAGFNISPSLVADAMRRSGGGQTPHVEIRQRGGGGVCFISKHHPQEKAMHTVLGLLEDVIVPDAERLGKFIEGAMAAIFGRGMVPAWCDALTAYLLKEVVPQASERERIALRKLAASINGALDR